MLGERGQAYRPSAEAVSPEPLPADPVTEPEVPAVAPIRALSAAVPQPTSREGARVAAEPARLSASRRAHRPAAAPDSAASTDNAPRTVRLGQAMANALREAWLVAKRDDLLLTYQDFADHVVRRGLGS
jgi:hypothetical protein